MFNDRVVSFRLDLVYWNYIDLHSNDITMCVLQYIWVIDCLRTDGKFCCLFKFSVVDENRHFCTFVAAW